MWIDDRVIGYVADIAAPDPYASLSPAHLWQHFSILNTLPRKPGSEDAARSYVREVAEAHGAEFSVDEYGNCVVRSNEPPGVRPFAAVQAHLDMVCEKGPGSTHDFDNDAIVPIRNGDKIEADNTTLGADNGIGVAAGLALLSDPEIDFGPIELIFTVEEEVGLLGAVNLDVSLMEADFLVNLDSEDEQAITVGCAGEQDLKFSWVPDLDPLEGAWSGLAISLSGLRGGHSGVQIHEGRANAIKVLSSLVSRLMSRTQPLRLVQFAGGSAHNAIPRQADVVLAVPSTLLPDLRRSLGADFGELEDEWDDLEPDLSFSAEEVGLVSKAVSAPHAEHLLDFFEHCFHGVLSMSERFSNTVATSANLALVEWLDSQASITVSIRGFVDAEVDRAVSELKQIGMSHGLSLASSSGYAGWEPRPESKLLNIAVSSFRQVRGRDPLIEVVHGGLECGVLVSRKPGLEAISIGPRIREAHSPREHVFASTVDETWKVLVAVLRNLRQLN